MDNNIKRKKVLKVIGLLGLFLLVFGLSYALFQVTLNGTKKVKVKTGKLELQLLDSNNKDITDPENAGYVINLDNAVPVSDEDGLQTQSFTFKLKNNGTIPTQYTIYLDDIALESNEERIDDQYIRYSLTKNGSSENSSDLTTIGVNPNRKLDSGVIKKNETNIYTLKVWIKESSDSEAMGKVFNTTLRVSGEQFISPFEEETVADYLTKDYVGTLTAPLQNAFSASNIEIDGLYRYTDGDGTTTYVYRGTKDLNNYVSFADQLWRILRIQADGSLKIVRAERITYVNETYTSSAVKFNLQNNSAIYNKYEESNVEGYVRAWYNATMMTYDDKIEENEYCSDRYEPDYPSLLKQKYYSDWMHLYGYRNRGEKVNDTYQWSPNMSCKYGDIVRTKVALITADEYILAGGAGYYVAEEMPYNNYLMMSRIYWTMSPAGFDSNNVARVYDISSDGNTGGNDVQYEYAVVPVLTLKANTTIVSGNGTSDSPYVVG